ncbi:MAG: lipid A deacylase LpxR family protein [Crocinitomicaceae bacterium]
MRTFFLFLFVTFAHAYLRAQEINNYSTLFDVRDSSFTRISYDNDLLSFRGTDRYYTQGIGIDVFSDKLNKNPLNVILFRLKNSDRSNFGIEFRTHGCTPRTILSDSVLIGDRPFSGVFSLGVVRTSHQTERRLRLVSQFELGMIGPAALGEEIQTGIHKITGDDLPLGWQHQIKNAPIVNTTLRLESTSPFPIPGLFMTSIYGQVKLGTFQTNLSGGFEFSIGKRNSAMLMKKHRLEYYVYSQSSATAVAYDASLMGGIINRDGYSLKYSELNALVVRQHLGFVFAMQHFSIAFDWAFISPEIKEGLPHNWGGLRLTFY